MNGHGKGKCSLFGGICADSMLPSDGLPRQGSSPNRPGHLGRFLIVVLIILAAALVIVVLLGYFGLGPLSDTPQQRAADATLDRTRVPPALEHRDRDASGSGQINITDTYVGSPEDMSPDGITPPTGFQQLNPPDDAFLGSWKGTQQGWLCEVSAARTFDKVEWQLYAMLSPSEVSRAKDGELAIMRISAICLDKE